MNVATKLGLLGVVLLVGVALSACSGSGDFEYDEDRGLFADEDLRELGSDGDDEARELLRQGQEIVERGETEQAILYYTQLAERYPQYLLALEARIRKLDLLVQLGEYKKAHNEMIIIVHFYKETLQQTRMQPIWESLRHTWYEKIGLGLFFANEERTKLGDLSEAIKVFERILAEEIRGRYAALCLLRIGDAHMARGNFRNAREMYLHVVESYPDFQQHNEHEQALFKAAEATMGLMKGAEYNLERLDSRGSETREKGALNLLSDYLTEYPNGRYIPEVRRLQGEILEVLVWRDYNAARIYERMGRREAARTQYWIVVNHWGNDTNARRYPETQVYVQRAERRLNDIGQPSFVQDLPGLSAR